MPARVLNLVVIADREWRGEIQNRLENVGRYHPSRTILCAVESGRETLDAWATTVAPGVPDAGHRAVPRGARGGRRARSTSRVSTRSSTRSWCPTWRPSLWSPHGHPEAVDSLLHLAQVVLVDSVNEPDPATAIARARQLAEEAYVVDLGWLRSTPWRERITATFDPRQWRPELGKISAVTARHRPDSAIAGLLFFGWLASRLDWEPGALIPQNGSLYGRAHARRQDVELTARARPDAERARTGRDRGADGVGHEHLARPRRGRARAPPAAPATAASRTGP